MGGGGLGVDFHLRSSIPLCGTINNSSSQLYFNGMLFLLITLIMLYIYSRGGTENLKRN